MLDPNRTDWKPVPPLAKRLLTEPAYQTKRRLVIGNTSRLCGPVDKISGPKLSIWVAFCFMFILYSLVVLTCVVSGREKHYQIEIMVTLLLKPPSLLHYFSSVVALFYHVSQ